MIPLTRLAPLLGLFFALPAVQAATVDAAQSGAVGDGVTLTTEAIQRAIDGCSAAGGGVVDFPAGRYLTGTIQIKNGVTLRLEAGATLLGSTRAEDYRNLDPFFDGNGIRGDGKPLGYALIVSLDADHVGIEGPGTVDGQGPALKAHEHPYAIRPFLLRWIHCHDVTVRDVTLKGPGAWTLNMARTDGARIEHVTIRSRGQGIQNNDGINLDSCSHIQVRHCDVISGDDALVIKATSPALSSHDISAEDCDLSSNTNAIKLGTEAIGGFSHIEVTHCRVTDTRMSGIALYEVDGADLRQVTISDVTMDGVMVPISVRLGARLATFRKGDVPRPAPGTLSDVLIRNVTAKHVGLIGILINGLPGHPVETLTLDHVHLEVPGGGSAADAAVVLPENAKAYPEYSMFGKHLPASAVYIRHARNLVFKAVKVDVLAPDARPKTVLVDAEGAGGAPLSP